MKNKILIIIQMLILIFVLTGCNVDYTSTIHSNQTISEQIEITLEKESIPDTSISYEEYFSSLYSEYANIEKYNVKNYSVEYKYTDDEIIAIYSREYNSLESYITNCPWQIIFNKNNSDIIKKEIEFDNSEVLKRADSIYVDDQKYKFTINSDKSISNSNAHTKNTTKGEYVWEFVNKNPDNISYTIKDNNNLIKEKLNGEVNLLYGIVGVGVVLIVLFIILIVHNRFKKVNKI